MSDCLFCKIRDGKIPSKEVFSNAHVYAFEDIHPGAPVHVLIIPKKHIAKASDLSVDDKALMGELTLAANEVARIKGVSESGYRLVMNVGEGAGQTVFHLHMHVIGGRELSWPPG
jgi:histidine triad (HIT) family protein